MSNWQGTGASRAWRKVRAYCLERDSNRCLLQLPGCIEEATEVDHIDNLAALGIGRNDPIALDPERCVSVCMPCHRKKTSLEAHAAKRAKRKHKPYIHPSRV